MSEPHRNRDTEPSVGPVQLPPLSLYVHFPWCVRRCPYCDFNAHEYPAELPVRAWLDKIAEEAHHWSAICTDRRPQTLFLGGGTPSLLPAAAVGKLLTLCRDVLGLSTDAEVTMEANPGTLELRSPADFRRAGARRLSLGVQSFQAASLQSLGRIHGPDEADNATRNALQAGFDSINLDLMYGLPGQSLAAALDDLRRAIDWQVPHISWYQLTIEPNTPFWSQPPALPDEERIEEIEAAGGELLRQAGFVRYEISAWAKPGFACAHNLNYWTFGDYLGLGPGAHSKISQTTPQGSSVRRWANRRAPDAWLASPPTPVQQRSPGAAELAFEFVLGAFRLLPTTSAPLCHAALLQERTGLSPQGLQPIVADLRQKGLLHPVHLRPSDEGYRYLNEVTAAFLPETTTRRSGGRQRRRALQIASEGGAE